MAGRGAFTVSIGFNASVSTPWRDMKDTVGGSLTGRRRRRSGSTSVAASGRSRSSRRGLMRWTVELKGAQTCSAGHRLQAGGGRGLHSEERHADLHVGRTLSDGVGPAAGGQSMTTTARSSRWCCRTRRGLDLRMARRRARCATPTRCRRRVATVRPDGCGPGAGRGGVPDDGSARSGDAVDRCWSAGQTWQGGGDGRPRSRGAPHCARGMAARRDRRGEPTPE